MFGIFTKFLKWIVKTSVSDVRLRYLCFCVQNIEKCLGLITEQQVARKDIPTNVKKMLKVQVIDKNKRGLWEICVFVLTVAYTNRILSESMEVLQQKRLLNSRD